MATSDPQLELIARAGEVAERSSDGHRHTVGAAVRTADGQIYVGTNVYHYTGGPCAELVALGAARAATVAAVTMVVAVGDEGRGVIAPCGRCRQIIADLHPGCTVIVPTPSGTVTRAVEELLPHHP
ncbi:MAG: hypothetical protein KDA97_07155 [Acidimicrobiales bacterium]|nr:hypothetical protein [Acidimicrobiales bacterium]